MWLVWLYKLMSTVNQCCLAYVLDVHLGDISHVTVCPDLRFRVLRAVSLKSGLPVGVQQPNKDSSWSAWLWRWNHYNSLKHWKLFTQGHSTTFQKTWIFMFPDLNASFLKSVTLSLWADQCINCFELTRFLWTFSIWCIKEMTEVLDFSFSSMW